MSEFVPAIISYLADEPGATNKTNRVFRYYRKIPQSESQVNNQEVKTWFYHHWFVRYPVKYAPAIAADAYFRRYFNMGYTSIRNLIQTLL